MNARSFISALNIQPEEQRLIALVGLTHATVGFVSTMLFLLGISLYFGDGRADLAIGFLTMGMISAFGGFVYLHIKTQFNSYRTLQTSVAGLTMLVILYFLALFLNDMPILWLGGLVLSGLVTYPLHIIKTSILKQTLSPSQIRIHSDLMAVSELGGGLLAGIILLSFSTTLNLLYVGPLLALIFLFLVLSAFEQELNPEFVPPAVTKEAEKKPTSQANHILQLIGFYLLLSIAIWSIEYALFDHAVDIYTTRHELANFLGITYSVISFVSILFGVFSSGQMLNRYGIRFGLLANPILLTLGFIALTICALFPTSGPLFLFLVLFIKGGESIFTVTYGQVTQNILLGTLQDQPGFDLNLLVRGVIAPLGAGLVGALFLLLGYLMPAGPLAQAMLMLPLLGLLLLLAFSVYQGYRTRLERAVDQREIDASTIIEANADSLALLKAKLDHPRPSAVIYVLDQLEDLHPDEFEDILGQNLGHPNSDVRQNVLERAARLRITGLWEKIKQRVDTEEEDLFIKGIAQRVLASLANQEQVESLADQLESDNFVLQRETMIGLLRNGDVEGLVIAGGRLRELINSEDKFERQQAAFALGDAGMERLSRHLTALLEDPDPDVKLAAVIAAGKLNVPHLWKDVAATLGEKGIGFVAVTSLIAGGDDALPALRPLFKTDNRLVLTRLCIIHGRIGTPAAAEQLERVLIQPDPVIQYELLKALAKCGHGLKNESPRKIYDLLLDDIEEIEKLHALYNALDGHSDTYTVNQALREDMTRLKDKLFVWLELVQPPEIIAEIQRGLKPDQLEEAQMTAIGLIEEQLSTRVTSRLLPIFLPELDATPILPIDIPITDILIQMIQGTYKAISTWTQTCALYTLASIGDTLDDSVEIVIHQAHYSSNPLISETAGWLIYHLNLTPTAKFRLENLYKEGNIMLSTVEKMIALKATPYFVDTPEIALYSIADELQEVQLQEGESLFFADEPGDCMFIIVDGHIKIHDNEQLITDFSSGDVFGELAVIDPAPRSATATATIETLLLRLDSEPFRELINDHGYIAHRIMRVLAGRLRHTQHLKTRADE